MNLRTSLTIVAVMLAAGGARAQTVEGFAGAGFGAADNQFHDYVRILEARGGADVLFGHYFGVGGDIGLAAGGGDAWVPTSVDGTFYFPRTRTGRATVFVRGGVTFLNFLTEIGHERAYNVAAGFLLWGDGHTGLRVELRDVIRPGDAVTIRGVTTDLFPTRHWASVNIGAAFR